MKRFSKFLTVLLVVSMIFPGIAQAAPVVTAESSAVQRLAGKGREETAVAASEMAYKDGAENVVLVGYNGEVDALTGTLLANAKKAPLLITNQASLTETTKKEIARLKAKNVYILGGENVVSEEVEIELKALKYNVKRIEGADREKTAIAVAKEVGGTINHVFLAKGYDIYADALSVGPVSAIKNMPVFLTNTNSMTPATIQAMKDLGVKEVTIVGGEKTVTKKVEDQLKGIKINRISGDDREKTALAVADKFFPSTETSILASGYIFADALVGGYIGAKMNAPILLTNTNLISAETEEFIADNSLKTYVLGGEKVVSDKVLKKIEAAVKAEKASDITVNETIKLNRNYNSVKVTANNIVVDLGGKTVKELTVSANDTTIKNGTVIKLNIEKTVVNVILEDIVDTEDSEHTFAGGGAKSIVLKGNTNLRGLVEVTSTTPIQIRAEGLNAGQGVTGTLIINTGAPVTIGVPVNEVEVQKENTSIKINAEVKKVNALAKTEITMGKDVKTPILEKAKDVEASAKDNNGKVEDFVVNDKLKPTEPVKPVEPTPGGGGVVKVSAINISGNAVVGATLTANPNAGATNVTYQWQANTGDEEAFENIEGATAKTFVIPANLVGKKIQVVGKGVSSSTATSAPVGPVKVLSTAEITLDGEDAHSNTIYGNTVSLSEDLKVTGTLKYHETDPTSMGFAEYDHHFLVFKIADLPEAGAEVTIKGKAKGTETSKTYTFEGTSDVVIWGVEEGENIEITVDYGTGFVPMTYTLDLSGVTLDKQGEASVANIEALQAALLDDDIKTINITEDILGITEALAISHEVTINGNGKKISAGTFETTTATNGLLAITSNATVNNLVLDGNATARGIYVGGNDSGITVNLNKLTIENCLVNDKSENRGTKVNSGAGVRATAGTVNLIINDCSIQNNTAFGCAGGISFDNVKGTLTVSESSITNNTGGYYAGGIWTASTAEIVVKLTDNTITGNKLSDGAVKYKSCCTDAQDIFINSNSSGKGKCNVAGGTIGCIHVEGEDTAGSILTVTGAANFTDVHGTNNSKLVISGDGANAKFGDSTKYEVGTYTWNSTDNKWVKGISKTK